MRHLHFGKLFFVVFSLLLACTVSARKPIKTLLITGQNNHNWQVSHVVLKQILENSGRFDVDFAISPEQGKDMSGFVLDFSPYQLVVLDYNGDSWPEETTAASWNMCRTAVVLSFIMQPTMLSPNGRSSIRSVLWVVGKDVMRIPALMCIGRTENWSRTVRRVRVVLMDASTNMC